MLCTLSEIVVKYFPLRSGQYVLVNISNVGVVPLLTNKSTNSITRAFPLFSLFSVTLQASTITTSLLQYHFFFAYTTIIYFMIHYALSKLRAKNSFSCNKKNKDLGYAHLKMRFITLRH